MRVKVLTLLTTAIAVVGIGVLPSTASASKSECAAGDVCFWSGKTFGRAECESGLNCFSHFHGYETGSHALANINPQSVWNHTGNHTAIFYVGLFGKVELGVYPGEDFQWGSPYTKGFKLN